MASAKEREAYGYIARTDPGQSLPIYVPQANGRSIKKQISSSSSKNSELLRTLSDTMTAPSELSRVNLDLEDLRKLLTEQEATVKKLSNNSKKDYKQHKKYRDSVISRFVYRLAKKPKEFDAKAMKEEKMYFESLQEQQKAESRRSELQVNIKDKEQTEKGLKVTAARHDEAHAKLDQLYQKIFTGPNPEFPEEDVREETFKKANMAYKNAKEKYKTATENIKLFNRAAVVLRQARAHVQNARDDLEYSIFGVSDYHFDALARSQSKLLEISNIVAETKVPLSEPDFQRAKVELANTLRHAQPPPSEIYSRHQLLQSIAQRQQILRVTTELLANLMAVGKIAKSHTEVMFRHSARSLEESRQALEQARKAAFEEVAGFGEAPPSYGEAREAPPIPDYHECCDRTAAFEQCDFQGPTSEEEEEGDLTQALESDRVLEPPVEDGHVAESQVTESAHEPAGVINTDNRRVTTHTDPAGE
ncbi:MAG: hypothetical protein M1828_000107 [Chrysothrix sp. TS-e1954]|nr:MAG: hypothetical protein M1828_000107 [Chrysothrix sp. TS-e1954]